MFSETMSIVAKLANGFALTLLGMGVVFVVLAILSFALDIMRFFMADKEKAARRPENTKKSTDASAGKDRMETETLIPVISAAIAAYMETTSDQLVVKSIREIPPKVSIWGAVGRQRQMADRF